MTSGWSQDAIRVFKRGGVSGSVAAGVLAIFVGEGCSPWARPHNRISNGKRESKR